MLRKALLGDEEKKQFVEKCLGFVVVRMHLLRHSCRIQFDLMGIVGEAYATTLEKLSKEWSHITFTYAIMKIEHMKKCWKICYNLLKKRDQ